MKSILLQIFFEALRREDIPVNVRDIARIRIVFSAQRNWSLSLIGKTLRSLLVHDPRKRQTFDTQFRQFFRDSRGHSDISNFDLVEALKDFQELHAPLKKEASNTPENRPKPNHNRLKTKEKPKVKIKKLGIIIAILTLVVFFLNLENEEPPPEIASIHFEPATIIFEFSEQNPEIMKFLVSDESVPLNTSTVGELNPLVGLKKEISIINESNTDIIIANLGISGDSSSPFSIAHSNKLKNQVIPAYGRVPITVHSDPVKSGEDFTATLSIRLTTSQSLFNLPLHAKNNVSKAPFDLVIPTPPTPGNAESGLNGEISINNNVPIEYNNNWKISLLVFFSLLIIGVLYTIYLYRWRQVSQEKLPFIPKENKGHHRFSFASIGGELAPEISKKQTKRIADILGYVYTGRDSKNLDIRGSVDATIRSGGIPKIRFEPLRETRSVLLLEDSLTLNHLRAGVVDSLCIGLEKNGVEFHRYRFRGSLGSLINPRGVTKNLSEFELDNHTYVVLIFTDGSSFITSKSWESLQTIAGWPRLAWIDLREPEFRIFSEKSPDVFGVPVFSGTAAGLLTALNHFLTSYKSQNLMMAGNDVCPLAQWTHDFDLETHLETTLGDAVLWAADCCFIQPCSIALAQHLRSEFYSQISSTSIQRFMQLPGVNLNSEGIVFSRDIIHILRKLWQSRNLPQRQKDVLTFILDQVRQAEPVTIPKTTIAYLTWEAVVERIRVELDPQNDYKRLAQLKNSPVGRYLETSFEGYCVSGTKEAKKGDKIELLCTPKDEHAAQCLASANNSLGIATRQAISLRWVHKFILAMLVLCTVTLGGYTSKLYKDSRLVTYWQVDQKRLTDQVTLWQKNSGQPEFSEVGRWGKSWTGFEPKPNESKEFQIRGFGTESISFTGKDQHIIEVNLNSEQPYPMIFKWIQPGTFQMGSSKNEPERNGDESPHTVTLSRGFFLTETEITQGQYQYLMKSNPSKFKDQGPNLPVEKVSWKNAKTFCEKLTKEHHDLGRLPLGWEYQLPTEAQWEYACRAGTSTAFHYGDSLVSTQANFNGKYPYGTDVKQKFLERTTIVKSYKPNLWGLYDMHGNVYEWCSDWYGDYRQDVDPYGAESGTNRVNRGGSWNSRARNCRSAYRLVNSPSRSWLNLGFRVAAVQIKQDTSAKNKTEGRRREIKLVWVGPGTFTMGSPIDEPGRYSREKQYKVTLSQGYYLGETEITQAQYMNVMGENPSYFVNAGDNAPVEQVTWGNALEFCRRLTEVHQQSGKLPKDYAYTLPTEAQWEYACRAASQGPLYTGDFIIKGERNAIELDSIAWYGGNSGVDYVGGVDSSGWLDKQYDHKSAGSHVVAGKAPNSLGLYDMLGNVYEWCLDRYGEYPDGAVADPVGPKGGTFRVNRGGSWNSNARFCRSAYRSYFSPSRSWNFLGFRVAAVQTEYETSERETEGRRHENGGQKAK